MRLTTRKRAERGTTAASRPLTICAIGYASSPHVAARVRCFADLGHRVFLITETASHCGIPGVTELVPTWDERLARQLWFRLLLWAARRIGGRAVDDAWRLAVFLHMLRQCRPDIVHVHFAYSYYGWLAGLVACRPLVVTVMGGDVLFAEQGNPTPVGKWLTLELLRKADYITSKSNYLTASLNEMGDFAGKTERIVWGVSLQQFQRVDASGLRARLGLGRERRVIFSPKILQPLYRVHLLVDAMATVRQHFPDAVLLVAEYLADLQYKKAIARQTEALGLSEHVIFCGEIEHTEMPTYYSLAEISVAVPSSDGLPQTLLESMACRTPNILSRLERYEEIVRHRESAYFVSATPAEVAAGICTLLGDPKLRERIAENAFIIVESEGDLEQQVGRVEARYRELAASVRPRAVNMAGLWATARSYYGFRAASRFEPARPSPKEA